LPAYGELSPEDTLLVAFTFSKDFIYNGYFFPSPASASVGTSPLAIMASDALSGEVYCFTWFKTTKGYRLGRGCLKASIEIIKGSADCQS
jgi:hypothetical protein